MSVRPSLRLCVHMQVDQALAVLSVVLAQAPGRADALFSMGTAYARKVCRGGWPPAGLACVFVQGGGGACRTRAAHDISHHTHACCMRAMCHTWHNHEGVGCAAPPGHGVVGLHRQLHWYTLRNWATWQLQLQ